MNIIDLSHNDDLVTVARKCNLNFRQIQSSQQQAGRQESIDVSTIFAEIDNIENVVVPAEVAEQLENYVVDYNDVENKPQIEGVTLVGNKGYVDLNLIRITNSQIEEILTY